MPFYMRVLWRVAYHVAYCVDVIKWNDVQVLVGGGERNISHKVSSTKMRTGEARISLLRQKDMPKQKKYQTTSQSTSVEHQCWRHTCNKKAGCSSQKVTWLLFDSPLDSLILGTRVIWTPYCSHSSACPRSQTTCWSRASSGRESPSTPFWSTLMLGCFPLYTIL